MSKTIELTKAFIIRAIKEEPMLAATGNWVGPGRSKKECPSCAVGSVMRRAMSSKSTVESIREISSNTAGMNDCPLPVSGGPFYKTEDLFEEASQYAVEYPMTALSYVFESLARTNTDFKKVRSKTVKFVRDFFPETVRVEINGYKPASDVKVVA